MYCLASSCTVWQTLVLFDKLLYCLTSSCTVWQALVLFDKLLHCLTSSCTVWQALVLFDKLLYDLTSSCTVWQRSCIAWQVLVLFDKLLYWLTSSCFVWQALVLLRDDSSYFKMGTLHRIGIFFYQIGNGQKIYWQALHYLRNIWNCWTGYTCITWLYRGLLSVNWPKPGYIVITCSTISNIPYNLIFITKFNDSSILIAIISVTIWICR